MSTVSRAIALRAVVLIAVIAPIAIFSGCYHYHIRANGNAVNSTYFRKTLDSSSLKQSAFVVPPLEGGARDGAGPPSAADCKSNGLYEVGVASKWTYSAGTVFSFGHWSRINVEWLCAKEASVIGPRGVQPRPSSPADCASSPGTSGPGANGAQDAARTVSPPRQKASRDPLTRRTVHAFFWGALQQNLLPPAPAAGSRSPANCKSMRQVRLPVNYGYALITVFSAGIWSPMRVAWQCNPDPSSLPNAVVPPMFQPVSIEDWHVHK